MIWRKHIHEVVLRLPDSWSNWNLDMLVFEERGNLRTEKNLSEQGREPITNLLLFFFQEAKTQSEQHKAEIQLLQDRLHLETDETFRRKKTFHMVGSWC